MNDNRRQIYINRVKQLAVTMVIKSLDTEKGLNQYVKDFYPDHVINPMDPKSWKYYRNISGLYHPVDQPIQVISMDTRELIDFNKANLALHKETYLAYQYGERNYEELVALRPTDDEMLIYGIIKPVDIDHAIAAREGEILGYDANLVETHEDDFIYEVQKFIDGFYDRHYNSGYALVDNLYAAAFQGVLKLNLFAAIQSIRLWKRNTPFVHSYHIIEFLESNGIDQHRFLNRKQQLWLYRNMEIIKREAGNRDNFDWIVEQLLSERNIPIAEYTVRHDITNQVDTLYPEPAFRRKRLNEVFGVSSPEFLSLDELLKKEDDIAIDNKTYREDNYDQIETGYKNSNSNVLATKVLESSMIDYSNSETDTLESILFNNWIDLSTRNMIRAYVNFEHPTTGEIIPLTSKDAFTFMIYAFMRSLGIELDTVPMMPVKRVPLPTIPTVTELMEMVDPKVVDVSYAEHLRDQMMVFKPSISLEYFNQQCRELHQVAFYQRMFIAYQEDMDRRGYTEGMVQRMYCDRLVELEPAGTHYHAWFAERNIDIGMLTQEDFERVFMSIMQKATGMDYSNSNSLKNIQQALIGLMSQLVSYTVQFLSEINESGLKDFNVGIVRFSDPTFVLKFIYNLDIVGVRIQEITMRYIQQIDLDISEASEVEVKTILKTDMCIDPSIDIDECKTAGGIIQDFPMPDLRMTIETPVVGPGKYNFIGSDLYYRLSFEERQTIPDVYNCYVPDYDNRPHIQDVVKEQNLEGLVWNPDGIPHISSVLERGRLNGLAWSEAQQRSVLNIIARLEKNK